MGVKGEARIAMRLSFGDESQRDACLHPHRAGIGEE